MKRKLRFEDIGKINDQKIEVKAGKLLISEPFMNDQYFGRSVVLLCEHNLDGTVGFILNKPMVMTVNEAMDDFPRIDGNVYFGGPVQSNMIHFIHRVGSKLPGSFEIANGIFWGGDFDTLSFLIDTKQVNGNDVRFFAGYSGWEPKQLKKELKEKTWIIGEGNLKYLFSNDPDHLWREVLKNMGREFSVIANFPEDPTLN
jgi:putative transcriptional regulator